MSGHTVFSIVLGIIAVLAWGLYLGLAVGHAPGDRLGLGIFIGVQPTLPILGMVVKGYSLTLISAMAACAAVGMVVGTLGHPERIYSKWVLTARPLSIWAQIRLVVVMVFVCAVGVPIALGIADSLR